MATLQRIFRLMVTAVAGLGLTWCQGAVAAESAQQVAKQIFEATGIKGGLIVHLGCGDGKLTAALYAGDQYLVHGLETDPARLAEVRNGIQARGLYGPVSVIPHSGKQLPYAENLVNLLVAENLGGISMAEVMRVLAPLGVAYVKHDGGWTKTVKPWPQEIDQWTHWLHDAGNNAVAHDARVGPPRQMQWVVAPLWSRGHEVISSVGAVVTAQGRIFYALDEGQTGIYTLPSRWTLLARDAFNGVQLWKRPLPDWSPATSLGGFGSGFRPRRMASDAKRLYLPLGKDAVLTALDAASGQLAGSLPEARGTSDILCADGLLLALCSPQAATSATARKTPPAGGGVLIAARPDTLDVLWKTPSQNLLSQTLALGAGRIFFEQGDAVVALEAGSGAEAWRTPCKQPPAAKSTKKKQAASTLVVCGGKVYLLRGSLLTALRAESGKLLWQQEQALNSGGGLYVTSDRIWLVQGSKITGYDPASGAVQAKIDASSVFTQGHHTRCYPAKATDRYLITANRGAEFVSLASQGHVQNDWLRGNCGHGVLPANGLLYAPPCQCFCYPGVMLTGFKALAPGPVPVPSVPAGDASRLERGPAYSSTNNPQSPIPNPQSPIPNPQSLIPGPDDWPTYRHDPQRRGATPAAVAAPLAQLWQAAPGGRLTPPVVAGGMVLVAASDAHTIHALRAEDGKPLWSYTAGGRIDSPPTVFQGLALFGCTDGWAYCLRAADGELVWRFQAAPVDRRIVAFGQLESPWRVHGSILLRNGVAYLTAGRSSYLDGGIWIFALDPPSGKVLHEARLDTWAPTREDAENKPFIPGYHMEGARSDILVGQGDFIYLGQTKFDAALVQQEVPYIVSRPDDKTVAMDLTGQAFVSDNEDRNADYEEHQRNWLETTQKELVAKLRQAYGGISLGARQSGLHVFSTGGFLDDSWFNRTYWMYSATWPGFYVAHRGAKTGQLLVVGPEQTYAVQAFPSRNLQSPLFTPGEKGYLLLADENDNEPALDSQTVAVTKGWGFTRTKPPRWFQWMPLRIRGMVLAGKTLFVAGPPDVVDPADPMAALEGRKGAVLRALSAADGKLLAEQKLEAPPVFDGLIAAAGRLLLCTTDGKVVCLGAQR